MGQRLKKCDIVKDVALRTGFREEDVQKVYEAVLNSIHDSILDGDDILLWRIGRFIVREAPLREYVSFENPNEKIQISGRHYVRFAISQLLKDEMKDRDFLSGVKDDDV